MIRRRQTGRRRRGEGVGEKQLEHASPLGALGLTHAAARHVLETLELSFGYVQRVAAPVRGCSCGCGRGADGSDGIGIGSGRTAETGGGLAGVVFFDVLSVVRRETGQINQFRVTSEAGGSIWGKGNILLDMSDIERAVAARLGDDVLAVQLREGAAKSLGVGSCLAR